MSNTSARDELRDAKDHIKEAARASLLAMRNLLDAALKALDRDGGASEARRDAPDGDPADTMTPNAGTPPDRATPPRDTPDRT